MHCCPKWACAQPDISVIPWSFSWADAQPVSQMSSFLGVFHQAQGVSWPNPQIYQDLSGLSSASPHVSTP